MPRDFARWLWDIHQAGTDILEVTRGKTLPMYLADRNLRRLVERNFEIVGEAITQCRREHPMRLLLISDAQDIVAFRNRLTHAYFSVENRLVWEIIVDSLPLLVEEVAVLLAQEG